MTVYIDTNTFSANPALYADAEKKKPLPRVIPSVLLNEGIVRIGFLGDYAPSAGVETVCAVASIPAPGNPLRVVTSYGTQVGNLWEVPINFDATEIADALVNRGSVNLATGIIVEGADTRREYQFWVQCFSSAQGEISPEETADAKTFADAAKLSADNAAESETNAAQFATDAAESATASAQSASASAQSASNADTSANNAAQSATNAKSSADKAETMAIAATSSVTAAKNHATNAANSASAAAQSASDASNSASSANTSAVSASNSATAAATSANNAAQSASAAKTSETNAKASETAAKASATAAAKSATNAATSATNAKASETNAATSATSAGNSATNAATSADEAESTLGTFRDEKATLETNIATNTANIDWLMTAIDSKWDTYMLARAETTGDAKNVATVNRAIAEYSADQTAWLPTQLITCYQELHETEVFANERLEPNFWVEFFKALADFEANPTVDIEWSVTQHDDGSYSSNCPYFYKAPTAPVVNFRVKSAEALTSTKGLFRACDYPVYLVNAEFAGSGLFTSITFNSLFIAMKATSVGYLFNGCSTFKKPFATNATNADGVFWSLSVPAKIRCDNIIRSDYFAYSGSRNNFNIPVSFPSATRLYLAFTNSGMDSSNIAYTLNSLPAYSSGSHVITFTGAVGMASTQRFESFSVTDDDGVEYTMDNCPTFDTDDEEQSLRKAFVLAVKKKGWIIEKTAPVAKWYNYMLEKAALTGDAANTATVERAKTELDTSGTSALAMRLYEDWLNLGAGYEAWRTQIGEPSPLDAGFWVAYFEAVARWEADSTAIVWSVTDNGDGTYSSNCPHFETTADYVVDLCVTRANGLSSARLFGDNGTKVVMYLPSVTYIGQNTFNGMNTGAIYIVTPKNTDFRMVTTHTKATEISAYMGENTLAGQSFASNNSLIKADGYFPGAKNMSQVFEYVMAAVSNLESAHFYAPKATTQTFRLFQTRTIEKLVLHGGMPLLESLDLLLLFSITTQTPEFVEISFGDEWEGDIEFPSVKTAVSFAKNRRFNQAVLLPALEDGTDAFLNSGMSAENISKTLDSLPPRTPDSGGTGIISFVGCPGASELTQSSPSVADAVLKGWTVLLDAATE